MNNKIILHKLTSQEIANFDLRIAGKLIKDSAFMLSRKVNQQLLEPMSKWIDDPGWINRFKISEKEPPDWAKYKRKERKWSQQEKELFRQRIKMYWQEFHKRRNITRKVANLLNSKNKSSCYSINNAEDQESEINNSQNYLIPVLQSYSPPEKRRRNTRQEFMQAMKQSISNLLPWRTILLSELNENPKNEMRLKDFKIYYMENLRKDTSSKLIHLLQLGSEGEITLSQSKPFGNICISLETKTISTPSFSSNLDGCDSKPMGSNIIIKDSEGSTYEFDWQQLSSAQKNKVVNDIKQNRILCKVM